MSKPKKNLRNAPSDSRQAQRDSKIRIIGGQWRGRKLNVLTADGLRPTGDRLRETLFNWLMPYLAGARCLDAFSGTGALAFEALSRGAAYATLIEKNTKNAQLLRDNIELLSANAEVFNQDFLSWKAAEPFDLIFLDPPFDDNLWQKAIDHLLATNAIHQHSLIYVEQALGIPLTPPDNWQQIKSKQAGQVQTFLFEVQC